MKRILKEWRGIEEERRGILRNEEEYKGMKGNEGEWRGLPFCLFNLININERKIL